MQVHSQSAPDLCHYHTALTSYTSILIRVFRIRFSNFTHCCFFSSFVQRKENIPSTSLNGRCCFFRKYSLFSFYKSTYFILICWECTYVVVVPFFSSFFPSSFYYTGVNVVHIIFGG